MIRIISFLFIASIMLSSCVTKKKFKQMQANHTIEMDKAKASEIACQLELDNLRRSLEAKEREAQAKDAELNLVKNNLDNAKAKEQEMKSQMDFLRENNAQLLNRLSDLSVVSKTGAESIKKSLETMEEQGKYIKDLTASLQRKDSLNLQLVMNLKKSLDNINDDDVNIEVKKGVVFISISDKLLFKSGSFEINKSADNVLAKIAKVVNDHKDIEILVEGHTDNVPMKNDCMKDNWDLSVMRSTSIVRSLQSKYGVDPKRMTAGGRSEFLPKTSNENTAGRSTNRRTEIIITPKLDQFFELMKPQGGK
jgi:chemotaxis protein MotB